MELVHVHAPPPVAADFDGPGEQERLREAYVDWRDREFAARASLLLQQTAQMAARDAEIARLRATVDQLVTQAAGLPLIVPKGAISPEKLEAARKMEPGRVEEVTPPEAPPEGDTPNM